MRKLLISLVTLAAILGGVAPSFAQGVERARNISPFFTSDTWVRTGDGTAAAPAYSFTSDPDTGMYSPGANALDFATAGVVAGRFTQTGLFTNSLVFDLVNQDVSLSRDAANTLAQRNGTAGQTFNLYNTYTSATNYERALLAWSGNVFNIGTTFDGAGVARAVNLVTAGTSRWNIGTTGHLTATTDNTYDIGASGSTRPRNIFAGTHFIAADGNGILAQGGTGIRLRSGGDGIITISNDANTGFTRLILGTNDASGVAWKKSSQSLLAVLGNDSGYAGLQAASFYSPTLGAFGSGTSTGTLVTNDAQTVANAGIVALGATGPSMLNVAVVEDANMVQVVLRGGGSTPQEVTDISGIASVTKDTATSINIYYDAAGPSGAGYYLQNLRGASRSIRIIRLGI